VRKQLLSIAESPLKRVEDEVLSIAKTVCDNFEDVELRGGFYELTLQLVIEQPFKIPFVAAVVLIVNTMRADIVEEILSKAAAATNAAILKGEWREVKLYVKFLGSLQGLLDGEGVFPVLQDLLTKAVDLQTESNEEVGNCREIDWAWLTLHLIDHRTRAGQNHSIHDPLYHEFLGNRRPGKGSQYAGKHGYHCRRGACLASSGRPISWERKGRGYNTKWRTQSAAEAVAERSKSWMGAGLLA
jgi:hypothetical protein